MTILGEWRIQTLDLKGFHSDLKFYWYNFTNFIYNIYV